MFNLLTFTSLSLLTIFLLCFPYTILTVVFLYSSKHNFYRKPVVCTSHSCDMALLKIVDVKKHDWIACILFHISCNYIYANTNPYTICTQKVRYVIYLIFPLSFHELFICLIQNEVGYKNYFFLHYIWTLFFNDES